MMGVWREQDSCVLHLVLDPLGRWVCGRCRGLVLWLLARSLHGCRCVSGVLAEDASPGHAVTDNLLRSNTEKVSASHC